MCMFSRRVEHVSATKIFARGLAGGRQALIYAMELATREELAMVLPLPVPPDPDDAAVAFVDLSRYPTVFDDLGRAFPMLIPGPQSLSRKSATVFGSRKTLAVHQVGAFEASFVPRPADFARLDPRFRLPPDVLGALPGYADWGFAVFQLGKQRKKVGVHPMALTFPRREADATFFPTVHVHDGHVPARAHFDHSLYAQLSPVFDAVLDWSASTARLGAEVDVARARELVDGDRGGLATAVFGERPNQDIWLRPPAGVTDDDVAGSGPSYAYRIRATYHFATTSHHQFPRWLATARDRLPALCAGVRAGLAELCERNTRGWQLGPLHDALPPHFMNGPMLSGGTSFQASRPVSTSGPVRVRFTPFTEHVESQDITLGFAEVPTQADATEINRALGRLLDRAVGAG